MDIEISQGPDNVTVARLNGRLDSPGVDRIETRFSAAVVAPGRDAAIDRSGVDVLASMGIRMLISSARALQQKGARLVLFGAPSLVQSVLETAAIDQIIPITGDEQQALARLAH
jgi:anti-sigma B factor antagonist